MKKNIGTVDKIVRYIIAAIIVVLYFTHIIQGNLGIVLLVVAGILVLTSLVGFCGLYALFNIKACPFKKKE